MEEIQEIKIRSAIMHDNKMLIVRNATDVRVPHSWQLPGDTLRFGEELEEAAERIAKEHTGLDVHAERTLYATTFFPDVHKQVIVITFLCKTTSTDYQLLDKYDEGKWSKRSRLIVHLHSALAHDFRNYHVIDIPELLEEDHE